MTARVETHPATVHVHGLALSALVWCTVVTCDHDGCSALYVHDGYDVGEATAAWAVTQRRRLSRAGVAATPGREVRPGISAVSWWPDSYRIIDDPLPKRPPAQGGALFRREDIERAMSQRPMTADDLREWQALMMEPASPRSFIVSAPLAREIERFGGLGRSDNKADALGLAWQSAPDAWVRRADMERRAVERTGRVLVAWLIGRWRR